MTDTDNPKAPAQDESPPSPPTYPPSDIGEPPLRLFQRTLNQALDEMQARLPAQAIDHLTVLWEMIAEANLKCRLVGDAAPEPVAIKHIADSLLLLTTDALEGLDVRRALDLGSGAGFPGLPLALATPATQWLLVEATGRRANFIEEVVFSLGLDNVAVTDTRAESLAHNTAQREEFDLVVVRAVASAAALCEMGLPFLKRGGRLIAYKGPEGANELADAAEAARQCGGEALPTRTAKLPVLGHDRMFLVWEKVRATPGHYPRREGIPQKRPLKPEKAN
jgi:16S rRNA (guanine527-N7)-methyltransferase